MQHGSILDTKNSRKSILVASWGVLQAAWDGFGASLARLEALGGVMRPCWGFWKASWKRLAPSWNRLRLSEKHLEPPARPRTCQRGVLPGGGTRKLRQGGIELYKEDICFN